MLQLQTETMGNARQANRSAMVAAGGLLWAFVVVIPAIHTEAWREFSDLHWWLACLPLGVLGTLQVWPRRIAALGTMPLAHLPILIEQPVLTGPKVYGPEAFAAIVLATCLWVWSCRPSTPSQAQTVPMEPSNGDKTSAAKTRVFRTHLVLHLFLGAGMLGALYFYEPFQAAMQDSYGAAAPLARMTIALFLFVVWLVLIARQLFVRLAKSLWSPKDQRAKWVGFALECANAERSRTNLKWSLIIATLSYGVLWILMHLEGKP